MSPDAGQVRHSDHRSRAQVFAVTNPCYSVRRACDQRTCKIGCRLIAFSVCVLLSRGAIAAESCRFTGKTDYNGQLVVVADAAIRAGRTQLNVRLDLDARPLPLIHTHYVMEEISSWSQSGIEQAAVNDRYTFDGHIVRQQWDVYDRVNDGLRAFRVQGKRAAQFQQQHPDFTRFWNPRMLGKPWLDAFPYSAKTRRPDLDLHHDPRAVRTPLALAFYWLRWLPRQGSVVPVFLPGFKEQKLVDLAIGPLSDRSVGGQATWRAPIAYPYLSLSRPSMALARTSADRHLLQLLFELHGVEHSARGNVVADGCTGAPGS